jgi:pentatricopeptide repeat protein
MLDLYGKNEPVDVKKMDEIIATMKSRNIEVTGNHYSSLIIAYGCTMHDLEGSLNIFRQLRNAPQTQTMWPMNRLAQGRNKLPDVLAYEALLSVLVMHHRIDLMQEYFEQMIQKDKVRPTAYIYNLLIKGWASVGDLAAARDIFERMVDPAAGAAAPNNHAPHMGHEGVQMVNGTIVGSPQDPVYREVCIIQSFYDPSDCLYSFIAIILGSHGASRAQRW